MIEIRPMNIQKKTPNPGIGFNNKPFMECLLCANIEVFHIYYI